MWPSLLIGLAAVQLASAQSGAYGQCGGIGWTGATSCVNGYTCQVSNDYYSQCLPGGVATTTSAATTTKAAAATPTLYLCGDSTMAKNGANDGDTDGWGSYVSNYLSLPVVNDAIGGRSARSYTREGRFTTVINTVKSGDYVIIEFGHNDGGSLTPTDNGRTDCAGSGEEKCQTVYDGVSETVLTYYAYLRNAANSLKAKGANVIISSPTPNNVCETGTCSYAPSRFTDMSKSAASSTGGIFIDHGQYVADRYITLGTTVVNSYYPNDHTHTSPAGANTVTQTFIRGLICQGTSGLRNYLISAGNSVPAQKCH